MPILDRLTTPVQKAEVIASAVQNGSEVGSAIPLKNLVALDFTLLVSAYTSGDASLTIELSDDGSTGWIAVDAKYLINEGAELSAVGSLSVGLSGVDLETQAYARVVIGGTLVLTGSVIALSQSTDR